MSTLKEKLSGQCSECEERKKAMIAAWQKTKAKAKAEWEKLQKEKNG